MVTIINSSRKKLKDEIIEIWDYRELLFFLTWRDIKVKYKQSLLGAGWAIFQPLMTMAVFYFVFNKIAKIDTGTVPYALFSLASILPWQFFASSVNRSSVSLVGNTNLISKVFFPRMIIPMSAASAPVIDFLIGFVFLIGMQIFYGYYPSWNIIFLPFIILLMFLTSLSISTWLSALNVKYRDVTYFLPFVLQIGLFVSPVAYPVSMIPEKWRLIYRLNPLVGVLDGFRWCMFGSGTSASMYDVIFSVTMVIIIFSTGFWYFRKTENTFADII